jgi:hypothetical protein
MSILDLILRKKGAQDGEVNNPDLVRAMHELALSDNPENRRHLYDALLASMLWVPVPELPRGLEPGHQTTNKPVQLQITGTTDRNGVRLAPAFTDSEALRNWDPNTPHLAIKAKELFRFVMGTDIQGIVINPFDPIRKMIRPGGRVTRAEIDLLSKGIVPSRIGPRVVQYQMKADQKVFIGIPAVRPSSTVEGLLSSVAAATPDILELYLFQMATPDGGSNSVIGIQTARVVSRQLEDELAAKLGEAVRPGLERGQSLDFLALHGEFGERIRARGLLIFRRS